MMDSYYCPDTIRSLIWRFKPFFRTYVQPILRILRPIVSKFLSLLYRVVLLPLWKQWKKLTWNRRAIVIIAVIVLVDITRVVSNKSQQHKLMATTISSAIHGGGPESGSEESDDSSAERASGLAAMRKGKHGMISHGIHQINLKSQQLDEKRKKQLLEDREKAQQKQLTLCEAEIALPIRPSLTSGQCKCTDPTIPVPKLDNLAWRKHHNTLVKDVQYAATASNSKFLDVVLLGGSLIEQWNGTHHWGTIHKPAQVKLFQSLFSRHNKEAAAARWSSAGSGNGKPVLPLDGIALGSHAATAPNLLWHLQNGILSQQSNNNASNALQFDARVFVILVGTTDLVSKSCTPEATVQGIIQVAEYITKQRPGSAVLIHGLLPRGEVNGHPLELGKTYDKILQVNQKLQDYCTFYEHDRNWYYWDTGDLFLTTTNGAAQLNTRLMADGIQPRMEAMELWGTHLVKAIRSVIAKKRKRDDEPFEKCVPRPPHIQALVDARRNGNKPLILYYGNFQKRTLEDWFVYKHDTTQAVEGCYKCTSTTDRSLLAQADAVVFHYFEMIEKYKIMPPTKYCGQSWVMVSRENPNHIHTRLSGPQAKYEVMKKFDISVTYRLDDDISIPYLSEIEVKKIFLEPQPMVPTSQRNKEFPVTWIASNCDAENNRTQYVAELMKYIGVKSYGKCLNNAPINVPRTAADWSTGANDVVRNHKFYLAFENSDCPYYSTEKLFRAYQVGLIPVVLGSKEATMFVPNAKHSAIFVRDFGNDMKAVATRLHEINNDDALFESFLAYRGNLSAIDSEFQNRWFQPNTYPRACHLCDLVRKNGPGYDPSNPPTGVTLNKLYCNNTNS